MASPAEGHVGDWSHLRRSRFVEGKWVLQVETISIDNLSNLYQSIIFNDTIRFSHWTVCYQKIDQDQVREKAKIIPKNLQNSTT